MVLSDDASMEDTVKALERCVDQLSKADRGLTIGQVKRVEALIKRLQSVLPLKKPS